MPSDRFASRTRTSSGGARVTAVALVAVVILVALLASSSGGHSGRPSRPPSSPTAVAYASPSPVAAAPSPSSLPLGAEWGVIPDPSGLAGLGGPVVAAAGPQGIVAIGSSGIAWSADGAAWTPVERGPIGVPVVATAGGYFALGDGLGWTSADGRTWANVDAPEARGFVINGIVAVGSELIAVGVLRDGGGGGWAAVFRSADGWTWVREPGTYPPFDQIAASGGIVVAAAPGPDGPRLVSVREADGTWTDPAPLPGGGEVKALTTRPGGGFVAIGWSEAEGSRHIAFWSTDDGRTWDGRISTEVMDAEPGGIVATTDGYVLTADPLTGGLWHSADGAAWTPVPRVPSFDRGVPTAVVATPTRLVGLGGSLVADQPVLAWTSPPIVPEPSIAAEEVSGRWAEVPWLPAASDGDRLVGLADGSLLLLGGTVVESAMSRSTREVWHRDAGGAWTPRAPMPVSRWGLTAAVAGDGLVWVLGAVDGETPETAMRRVDVYDPAKDRWFVGPSLPPEVSVLDALALPDGTIVAVASGIELWRVGPGERSWTRAGRVPWEPWSLSAAPLPDGSILAVGAKPVDTTDLGQAPLPQPISMDAFRIDPMTGAAQRRSTPTAGGASGGMLVALPDGRVAFVCQYRSFYGAGGGLILRRVDAYDPAVDRWERLTTLPEPRVAAGVAVDSEGRLWVGGGADEVADVGPASPSDRLWVWTPKATSRPHGI